MKSPQKFFFHIIFLFYFINSYPISLHNNFFKKIDLYQEKTEILLESKNYKYVIIESFFSEQSNYITTFNQYEQHKESNSYDYSKNQTDLIIKSEFILGKNRVILYKKDKMDNDIVLSIFLKDKKVNDNKNNNFVYIKYIVSNNINEENYDKDNKYLSFENNSENSDKTDDDNGEISDEEVDKNREKNKMILFIVLASFIGIVLITCIAVISYLYFHNITVEETIEEDHDYSDIGGITPNKSGSDNNEDDKSADK